MGRFFYEDYILKKIILLLLLFPFLYSFVYEFKAKNNYNKDINFENFENKLLVIFVANQEFKTSKQLIKLNKLYNKYKTQNIIFVGFAIKNTPLIENNFCVLNYGVDFDMIGISNNKLSKLKKYITNIYDNKELILYAPIIIHNREIMKVSNINELKVKLIGIFDSN